MTRADAVARRRAAAHAMRYDGEGGYVFAAAQDGTMVMHPRKAFEGTSGIAVIALVALLLSRTIAIPLGVLRVKMEQLAKGDLSVEVPDDGRSDEIGWMIRAVQVFRDNGLAMRRSRMRRRHWQKQHAE